MQCLRCGYCCTKPWVVIVIDPKRGLVKGNIKALDGKTPCPHLRGDTPGSISCAVHNEKWYKKTPCFSHGQIEEKPTDECRMGRAILDGII